MEEESSKPLSESPKKKSGQQMGQENLAALRRYIEDLKAQGGSIPSRNGQPNKTAIALACGFRRQVFETNVEVAQLLEQAVKNIGLDSVTSGKSGRDVHTQKRLDSSNQRNKELEEKLTIKTVEVEKLRQEMKGLKERLQHYEVFEEVMATSGRRLIP